MKNPTFGICAPSSYARLENFEPGLARLRALGHDLVVHPQSYGRLRDTQLAGTAQEKIAALYDLMADPKVDMILTACGGQTAAHILAELDYARLTKPIIGFSDTTSLLNAAYAKTGIIQYHGPGVTWFKPDRLPDDLYQQFLDLITGANTTIPLPDAVIQKPGVAAGPLIGGNLSVFQSLLATPYLPDLTGAILFFEDVGAELSTLDRILNQFRLAGILDRAAGLIFGQFTDTLDTGRPFGFPVPEIIAQYTQNLKIPVVTNGPFGHTPRLISFPVGATVTLDAHQGTPYLEIEKL